jgi:hypothetical protein
VPEPINANEIKAAAEERWASYNRRMADLFRERDRHPVDSTERAAAAERILALWVAEGD